MKKFLKRITWFILPLILLFLSGLFLPATPRTSTSLLFAALKKDSLLANVKAPRIIFVGGSNLSMGLNSRMIKDSLHLNPVNTAIHAGLGLKYMLENTLPYIKEGDTIILVPEYSHFYRDYSAASEELLRSVADANPSTVKLLNTKQVYNLIPFLPKFSLSKFKPSEYRGYKDNKVYSRLSFNEFGDSEGHWNLKGSAVAPKDINGEYNADIINKIKAFQNEIEKKKATLYISFPGLQDKSYNLEVKKIKNIEKELIKSKFKLLGNTNRYVMPDSLMFDTPYHLTKQGLDLRTKLLIEDYKKFRN